MQVLAVPVLYTLAAAHCATGFRLMELPLPDVDELGRPWWSGTGADVSKAYRRLSILVHPARS